VTTFRELQRASRRRGPAGAAGADGIDGDPGSVIYFGNEVPPNPIGEDKNVYFEKDANSVVLKTYQKSAGAWSDVGDVNPTWTSYNANIRSGTGTITSFIQRNTFYRQLGLSVEVYGFFTINVNGTGATKITMDVPNSITVTGLTAIGGGWRQSDNKMCLVAAAGLNIDMFLYDGTYPGGDLVSIAFYINYEAQ